MKGTIIKVLGNTYKVISGKEVYECRARGKFRKDELHPMAGDHVKFDEELLMIEEVYKRDNELFRPQIANVDQVLIIISAIKPKFDTNLLDKLLVLIEYNDIKPVIVVTKLDLLDRKQKQIIGELIKYYKKIGYEVYRNTEKRKIKKLFKNKTSVLAGQSGAGKSTLLNRLNTDLELNTNEISEALGRGKHTTRHVELMRLFDGWVADTPGFSALDLEGMSKIDIKQNFIEFYEVEDQCDFKTCLHGLEHNCKVKQLVEQNKILATRYKNYLKFIGEVGR